MKIVVLTLSLILSSSAFANQIINCPSFGDTQNTSVRINSTTNKASVNNKFGSSPYSISLSSFARKQAGPNEFAFEGDNLVDSGKVILFNNKTGAVKLFTYNFMTYQEMTLGPVNCQVE